MPDAQTIHVDCLQESRGTSRVIRPPEHNRRTRVQGIYNGRVAVNVEAAGGSKQPSGDGGHRLQLGGHAMSVRAYMARPDQSRQGEVMNSSQAERLQWITLTVLGLVAGLAIALPLGVPIFAIAGAMVGTPIVLSIVGLSLGTAQWPIIRRHLSSSWWWVVVSALGMAVGLTA